MDIRTNPQSYNPSPELGPVKRPAQPPQLGSAPSPDSAATFNGDQAQLSRAATLISQTSSAQAATTTEVRQDKVDAVRSALASGSYDVNPSDVAGKLIDHLLG